jgi:hypothetical protein
MPQGADGRRLLVAEHSNEVAGVGRQPGALRDDVEGPKLAGDPRVLELEAGIEIDHAVVPLELAAIDHDGHGGGQECLGERPDLKHGARVDRRAAGLAAHPEALGVDETVAGDDADGEFGQVVSLHPAPDVALEIGDQRRDARRHRRRRFGRLLGPRDIRQLRAGKHGGHHQREHDAGPRDDFPPL